MEAANKPSSVTTSAIVPSWLVIWLLPLGASGLSVLAAALATTGVAQLLSVALAITK